MKINREKYNERHVEVISINRMNVFWMLLFLAILLLCHLIYYFLGSKTNMEYGLLLGIIVIGIVLHELTHAIVAVRYAEQGWKSIKFGVMWKYGAFYCHCNEPMTLKQYRAVIIAPTFATIITLIVSLIIQNWSFTFGSAMLLASCIGDLMTLAALKKEKDDALVLDYTDKIGAAILEKKDFDEQTFNKLS